MAPISLDQAITAYILAGIHDSFNTSFSYSTHHCRPTKTNMLFTKEHPSTVTKYLDGEVPKKRLIQMQPMARSPPIQITPLGTMLKQSRQNEWRLIMDLSSPARYNINDKISQPTCSLCYAPHDNTIVLACLQGHPYLKSAYLNSPSAPRQPPTAEPEMAQLHLRQHHYPIRAPFWSQIFWH